MTITHTHKNSKQMLQNIDKVIHLQTVTHLKKEQLGDSWLFKDKIDQFLHICVIFKCVWIQYQSIRGKGTKFSGKLNYFSFKHNPRLCGNPQRNQIEFCFKIDCFRKEKNASVWGT